MSSLMPVLSEQLSSLPSVRHAYFTRPGGLSEGIYSGLNAGIGSNDDADHVRQNRQLISDYLGVSSDNLASPYQVHSPDVIATNTAWSKDRPKADALVTTKRGLALGIVTADCGPVLFADAKNGVIGAAHAGWQGALTGVLENTIAEMEIQGADRKNIVAVLGPLISAKNYEVGPEFPNRFLALDEDNQQFFSQSQKPDHHMFDLDGFIVQKLIQAGVQGSSVQRCTYEEEENFFSYRRTTHRKESDYGRQLSAIVLE